MREIEEITQELNRTHIHYDMVLVVTGLIAGKIIVEGLENVTYEEKEKIRSFKNLQKKLRHLNEELDQCFRIEP